MRTYGESLGPIWVAWPPDAGECREWSPVLDWITGFIDGPSNQVHFCIRLNVGRFDLGLKAGDEMR